MLLRIFTIVGLIYCTGSLGIIKESDDGSRVSSLLGQFSSDGYVASESEYANEKYRTLHITMERLHRVLGTVQDRDTLSEMKKIKTNIESHLRGRITYTYDQKVQSIATGIIEVVEGGYKSSAYNDGFGTITVGFGNTFIFDKSTGEKRKVKRSDRLNMQESMLLKKRIIKEDYEFLNAFLVKYRLNINSLSQAALVSFIYNIGKDAFNKSEVARLLTKGKITKAVNTMKNSHTTSKGMIAGGLVRRRSIESSLLSTSIKTTKRELAFN